MIGSQVCAAVVGAEGAGGRDGDEDALGVVRVEQDGVQAHPAGAGLPEMPLGAAQAGEFLPGLAAIAESEQGGILDPGVDRVRVGQRGLQVPDALEFPGMLRAVVPLVRAGVALVGELVADRLPGLAAVIRALDHLPEPAGGLRGIEPVRVDGRTLDVVDLPAGKVRAADLPRFALSIRSQNKRALARAYQNSYPAHFFLLSD